MKKIQRKKQYMRVISFYISEFQGFKKIQLKIFKFNLIFFSKLKKNR